MVFEVKWDNDNVYLNHLDVGYTIQWDHFVVIFHVEICIDKIHRWNHYIISCNDQRIYIWIVETISHDLTFLIPSSLFKPSVVVGFNL